MGRSTGSDQERQSSTEGQGAALHRALAWCWAALSAFAAAVSAEAFIGDGAGVALTSCALLLTAGAAWQTIRTRRPR